MQTRINLIDVCWGVLMYVCVCRAVTEKNIRDAVRAGAHTMKDLREQLGVGEDCGCCGSCAKQCLREANAELSHDNPHKRHLYVAA
jgi:bacterioferritin-associated ferredoxin